MALLLYKLWEAEMKSGIDYKDLWVRLVMEYPNPTIAFPITR